VPLHCRDREDFEGYSGVPIEVQRGYGCDGFRECLDGATVVEVHDPPCLEVGDGLLDDQRILAML
jgi:hypothetical protein